MSACRHARHEAIMRDPRQCPRLLIMTRISRALAFWAVLFALCPAPARAATGSVSDRAQTVKTNSPWVTGYYPAQYWIEPVAAIPWGKYSEIMSCDYLPGQTGDARYPLSTAIWQSAHDGKP